MLKERSKEEKLELFVKRVMEMEIPRGYQIELIGMAIALMMPEGEEE